jgi:hypothetical protein
VTELGLQEDESVLFLLPRVILQPGFGLSNNFQLSSFIISHKAMNHPTPNPQRYSGLGNKVEYEPFLADTVLKDYVWPGSVEVIDGFMSNTSGQKIHVFVTRNRFETHKKAMVAFKEGRKKAEETGGGGGGEGMGGGGAMVIS